MKKGLDKLKEQTIKNILSGPNNVILKPRIINYIKEKGPGSVSLTRPVSDLSFHKPKGRSKVYKKKTNLQCSK